MYNKAPAFAFHRQLLKGVDNLKLISEVLASVDKITEDSPPGGATGAEWLPPEGDTAELEGAVGGSNT